MTVKERVFCTERQLRLFLVACCRLGWYHLPEPPSRRKAEVAERFADGQASTDEVLAARTEAPSDPQTDLANANTALANSALHLSDGMWHTVEWGLYPAYQVPRIAALSRGATPQQADAARAEEMKRLAALVREFFGPLPFRRIGFDPAWLAWNDGAVGRLARKFYDDRAWECTPILADALTDAGCADADILGHLRVPTGHVRGCWVLDLILGQPASAPGQDCQ